MFTIYRAIRKSLSAEASRRMLARTAEKKRYPFLSAIDEIQKRRRAYDAGVASCIAQGLDAIPLSNWNYAVSMMETIQMLDGLIPLWGYSELDEDDIITNYMVSIREHRNELARV